MPTCTNRIVLASAALMLAALRASADTTVSIDASVQGIFTSWGQNNKGHNAGPGNILCGRDTATIFRNYFVFNLPPDLVPPGKQIIAATLIGKLPWHGYLSVDASETWTLFDVTPANYPVLINESASISGRTDVFDDLGTGNNYGARSISIADEPAPNTGPGLVPVALTAPAFFEALSSRIPQGSIIIGGSITTLVGNAAQRIFGFSGYEQWAGGRATLSITLGAPPCPGDLNADGFVDDSDFVLFAAAYDLLDCADPAMPPGCPADLNADSTVDDSDFVSFVGAYDSLICP
ncbi:MAG: hypothetical protein JNK16_09770 [Phycisphaerales bacterium]|nr:hypothetical protein [Phycisphaerales bacterium]